MDALTLVRNVATLYQQAQHKLQEAIPSKEERHAVTMQLLGHITGHTMGNVIAATPFVLPHRQQQAWETALERLQQHEPIQYVIGHTSFLGQRFYVDGRVLIPRPETAMMAQQLIQAYGNSAPASILDLCTGSGCLAISLAKAFPNTKVTGLDVSDDALEVARQNAQYLGVAATWLCQDLLTEPLPSLRWHVMVSNPPYVRIKEKATMQQRVLGYEPHQALFVPEDNPFVFYERITKLAVQHLYPGGSLYMELNTQDAPQVRMICKNQGLVNVNIHQDDYGQPRWVTAHQPLDKNVA